MSETIDISDACGDEVLTPYVERRFFVDNSRPGVAAFTNAWRDHGPGGLQLVEARLRLAVVAGDAASLNVEDILQARLTIGCTLRMALPMCQDRGPDHNCYTQLSTRDGGRGGPVNGWKLAGFVIPWRQNFHVGLIFSKDFADRYNAAVGPKSLQVSAMFAVVDRESHV